MTENIDLELTPSEASMLRALADQDGVSLGAKVGEILRRDYYRRLLLLEMEKERDRDARRWLRKRPAVTFDDLWAASQWTKD